MTNIYYQDNLIKFWCMDFRENDLPDECVQCVITSPPYWGLRKYSGEQDLIWGDNHCEHEWGCFQPIAEGIKTRWTHNPASKRDTHIVGVGPATCSLCGAWKGAYGLEPTPEMYVQHTIEILREIRRVLRKDGVVFWNIGDSYLGSNCGYGDYRGNKSSISIPIIYGSVKKPQAKIGKPKDMALIPFRVAIAAQEDGWWVRSVIIWSKPNPMPESVTDRPTESHEYILMLTKNKKYYWDADAVREPLAYPDRIYNPDVSKHKTGELRNDGNRTTGGLHDGRIQYTNPSGRNIRTVWEFPTQPYPAAHFAVFPEKLPELCIKATTPEIGCCSKCGAPWERKIKQNKATPRTVVSPHAAPPGQQPHGSYTHERYDELPQIETIGWIPTCKCNADKVSSIVLDPFMGSGTTLWVAKILNRKGIGYEISEEYCALALERNRQMVMELR